MLYVLGKHYRTLIKELRNCIIRENLDISKEEKCGGNYGYFTHIYLDDKLIPVKIEVRAFNEEICIFFWHDFVPKDRFDVINCLVEEINARILFRRFFIHGRKDNDRVIFFISIPVIDTSVDKKLFRKTFAYAIACCKIFFPMISNVIESGNGAATSGDWEKAISDHEKIRIRPFIR